MSGIRAKALGYYRDQCLHVIRVETPGGSIQPTYVEALVKGFRRDYRVVLEAGVWRCPCDGAKRDCVHRAAVQLATGHKSAAAKPDNKTAASAATPAATTAHHR